MINRIQTRKGKKRSIVKIFRAGRVCRKNGCKQRLSIYNSAIYCHAHRLEFLDI